MKKITQTFSLASFFIVLTFLAVPLSALDKKLVKLQEKRTEFTQTGTKIDSFFDSYFAKIHYSFTQVSYHFSCIFESAEKEGREKASEKLEELKEETIRNLQKESDKVIRDTVEKKSALLKEKLEKASTGKDKTKEKNKEKNKSSLQKFPALPEAPEKI